jgi:GT2 family glycosyltransferase
MSVIIITPDRYETVRETMKHLRAQTARDRLEIVIVAPSANTLGLESSELNGFCGFRVVEIGGVRSLGQAWAAGVRHASAPVVIYAEDHTFPDPRWAEALIDAHRQPWAMVGPVMGNANPDSLVSWANFFTAYGRWAEPAEAGEIDDVPPHNSACKRVVLLDYGPELEAMLEVETLLHRDLRAKGYRFYLEPAARTHHVNFTMVSPLLRAEFNYGRLFAAARAAHWSLLRRLIYGGGAPLIPLVRLGRIRREIRRTRLPRHVLLGMLPALLIGLVSSAAGEMFGYALGAGNAPQGKWELEFHRNRYLKKRVGEAQAAR